MSGSSTPVEVFFSYAHEDEPFRAELEKHLSLLQRQGVITAWHDRHIAPGTDWAQAIDEHLERASVILLLVSADFLASDYCYGIEMRRALERHQANEARVIPILLRPVDWKGAPFAHLQALPTNTKPITTWGNQDEAFANVAAGFRRAVEDLSLLQASAPRAALPRVWNIPYPRNSYFLGREEIFSRLRTQLQAGQITALAQPQAISGLGGIGKTQIAVEYAYRYYQDYQAVLWARAESWEALIGSYVTLADLLTLPEREAKDQAITVQAVKTWLQTHRQWLLILDNADDLAKLSEFLPPVLGGHLLLTTRASALGRLANRIEIDTLPPEQGALLVLRRAGLLATDDALAQASTRDQELAVQITEELGGLPLALDQAGAYLEETGASLSEYQQLYQQHHTELLKQRRGLVADHPEPVATTWSLSFTRVEERNPAAADLLRLCAFLHPDAIAREIITQGATYLGLRLAPVAADAFLLGQTIEALRAYSLICRDARDRDNTLSIHRLVQAALKDTMDEQTIRLWTERTIRAVSATFPEVEFATLTQCQRYLPHAQRCALLLQEQQLSLPEAIGLFRRVGWYLGEHVRYAEAEPLLEQALVLAGQMLEENDPQAISVTATLGWLYLREGKYSQAEPLLLRTLALREQYLEPSHPDTSISLNNLAQLYQQQGKYSEAESLLLRALTLNEQARGASHTDVAIVLNNLASLYKQQGKYEQAEPLLHRALSIQEQQAGPTYPLIAMCLSNLASLYKQQGKYEQAELLLVRALSIREREQQLGPLHTLTATSLNNLAELYRAQGKYEQAEPLYLRALAIYEQQLGAQHPNTQGARENYASLLRAMGRDAEAALLEAKQTSPSPQA